MGDFFTYVVDAELYLGLIWLVSYLWINQHIWYPKVFVKSTVATKCPTSQLQSPRLATSEQIFGTPWYDGLFIDQVNKVGFSKLIPFLQSIMMNRRRDGKRKVGFLSRQCVIFLFVQVRVDELEETEEDMSRDYLSFPKRDAPSSKRGSVKASDTTTRIYACATMWHETEDEMLEMLKSIFR